MKIYDATIYQIKDMQKYAENRQDIELVMALEMVTRLLAKKSESDDSVEAEINLQ